MLTNLLARAVAPSWLASRSAATATPAAMANAQSRILAALVDSAAGLPVGQRFGLDRLPAGSAREAAFRAQVPLTGYGDYADFIERAARGESDVLFSGPTLALAQTSGTTSSAGAGERYIPQNRALLNQHARGGAAAFHRLLSGTGPQLFGGKLMMLGGSTNLTPNQHGIPAGDLSGICVARIPRFLRALYEPGAAIALEQDWERKLQRIVERCANADIRLLSGIPSWCLVLFARLCAARGVERLQQVWPNLGGFIHGGCGIDPYLGGLREHLSPATLMQEVYPASEGFIAIGSRPWRLGDGVAPPLELLCAHGIYIELVPDGAGGEAAVGPGEVAAGQIYKIAITTPGGLLRYQIGDLVLGVGPGLVRFAGRSKARLSVFGEHVEGYCLDEALAAACAETGAAVSHYHVAPVLPSAADPRGRHQWWIEFSRPPGEAREFIATIDRQLCRSVLDYAAHRAGDIQLTAPELVAVPTGTFHRHLAARGQLGGQHKVPQAWPDHSIADQLASHCSGLAVADPPLHQHATATVTP